MKFKASRLSEGNKLFPATITVLPHGVTLKVPGLFGGSEQTIPFNKISSVDLETPFVGYSTIKIYSIGWDVIIATGFTKPDVKQIKEMIINGQNNLHNPRPTATPITHNVVKTDLKWVAEIKEMKELLDDEVISEEDFNHQKLKLFSEISIEEGVKLTDVLRELKDMQEDEIITEQEFQIIKQNLMHKS
jgi:CRISPR/Cas system type I-B associated protein Csh2 (Cas7 group RAMP superfamily)